MTINTPFFADYNDVHGKLFANHMTFCGKFHYIQIAHGVNNTQIMGSINISFSYNSIKLQI